MIQPSSAARCFPEGGGGAFIDQETMSIVMGCESALGWLNSITTAATDLI